MRPCYNAQMASAKKMEQYSKHRCEQNRRIKTREACIHVDGQRCLHTIIVIERTIRLTARGGTIGRGQGEEGLRRCMSHRAHDKELQGLQGRTEERWRETWC